MFEIVETVSSIVTSTKQFVWVRNNRSESRDSSGTMVINIFSQGQTISGSNYFYTKDHLGSVCEMTDSSENIQARYSFDPYGRMTKLQGSHASDFQYAGYYFHSGGGWI